MKEQFKVGIVGLGLIGGSMARAYSASGHIVLAHDTREGALNEALDANAICGRLTFANAAECDVIYLAVYPVAALEWLRAAAPHLTRRSLVIDLCGTKRNICRDASALADQ
ncbi:MAG: prephenate dehydrogenase/arogenate dehydrogenase family protein, partial [Clostridia bacterium]|nr:prephenate dehydrogenase/arogenate dehydrogenase family protein [Clostridia bacterium]